MKAIVAIAAAVLTTAAYGAGLESLEPHSAPLDGLPDMNKPVYLVKSSLVCLEGNYLLVAMSKHFGHNVPADAQFLSSLNTSKCAFSDREMRVVIRLPDAGSGEYASENYWRTVRIVWRNPSGQIWTGYTMIENLHN